ncbi:GTP cyclohydrolase 1 [Microbacterium sorbitolivorans]|uniref:GTP cyclohydrolase 1 n=1 Tax=Microbacterium sorbitolivorans TaxID=1867410 RepID=A0A367XTJ7_9MICO|nr:GTP cyclohydrolase I [Microbacterium sorbitolivorans]RCK56956.1 GTP cyclohydrolase I [Microbacterium sorbitolivorans]GGF47908.1 GTP cyclohydrolase 1 [Microbacterium sorbitolivorans]
MAVDTTRIAELTRELLVAIGEDPDRAGLRETPERVAGAMAELFAGIGQDPEEPLRRTIDVSRGPAPETVPTGAVLVRDITFRSVCEHHLLPFQGRAHIAYLPADAVVGLGSLARVLDICSARPQVQERLGEQVADAIEHALDARGVFVMLDAEHQCLRTRGEKRPDASTVTVAARGDLATQAARAEMAAYIIIGEQNKATTGVKGRDA